MRDIISFCQNYCWIKSLSTLYEPGLDRFIEHFHAGSIAYMLNGYVRYSQEYSKFPNIYSPVNFKVSNLNYLWLKRLIMQLLYHYELMDPKASASPEVILDYFVAKKRGYPEPLVRECLNELTMIDGSNLTGVELKSQGKICKLDNLFLTQRGLACMRRNVFENFAYLQLIIDDYNLPILQNQVVWSLFSYLKHTYGYLIASHKEYRETLLSIIDKKALQVLLFLQILKYSLKYEQAKFPRVFEFLKQDGVPIIEIDKIRNRNTNQIATAKTYIKHHGELTRKKLTEDEYKEKYNKVRTEV